MIVLPERGTQPDRPIGRTVRPFAAEYAEYAKNSTDEREFLKRSRLENQLGEMVEGVFPVMEVMGVFVDVPVVRYVVLL